MNRLAKLLHLLGAAGFLGALAAQLAAAHVASAGTAVQAIIDATSRYVLQPGLLLLITSGLLSMAVRPAFLEQRWLWLKMLLLLLIAPLVWWHGPQAVTAPADTPLHRFGGWLALLLSALAFAIAVWRPRLGQPGPPSP